MLINYYYTQSKREFKVQCDGETVIEIVCGDIITKNDFKSGMWYAGKVISIDDDKTDDSVQPERIFFEFSPNASSVIRVITILLNKAGKAKDCEICFRKEYVRDEDAAQKWLRKEVYSRQNMYSASDNILEDLIQIEHNPIDNSISTTLPLLSE